MHLSKFHPHPSYYPHVIIYVSLSLIPKKLLVYENESLHQHAIEVIDYQYHTKANISLQAVKPLPSSKKYSLKKIHEMHYQILATSPISITPSTSLKFYSPTKA